MGDTTVKALDGIDFCVKDQEFIAIIGKVGRERAHFLHMLGGLDTPDRRGSADRRKEHFEAEKEQLAIFAEEKLIHFSKIIICYLNVYENVRWNFDEEKLTRICEWNIEAFGYRRRKICSGNIIWWTTAKSCGRKGLLQQRLLF